MNEYNEYGSFSHTWKATKDPFFPVLKAKDALKALENNSENVLTLHQRKPAPCALVLYKYFVKWSKLNHKWAHLRIDLTVNEGIP